MDHHEPSAGSRLTRRSFLAAAAPLLVTAGSALAQPSAPPPGPRVKGPRVWLDMDQAELDAAYDQSVYAPNLRQIIQRQVRNSPGHGRR